MTVAPERLARWLDGFAERHGDVVERLTPLELHLVGEDGAEAWLTVPFGPLTGTDRAAFLAHALRPRSIGVLLVRRGGYGVGVFDGLELTASKVGSSYVQGTTKAGGWSQQRFARRRANQAKHAFGTAADEAARVVLPQARRLDAVVCGGDRAAVDAVLGDPRLTPLRQLVTDPFLAVPDPRLRVLQATPAQYRAVRIALEP
ncbi:MAG: acVLRF1 family peptidyl-tRNA hydrolase [Jatrophihabitans sp.]